ncbi:Dabb family protein [Pedobacter sp. JY14-1]|uniref:Dabb family protein n=1 Tax=Pedobacter sp. JY14-1 TaxID=3034151 RepID=UPI0023E203FF|nr:Dabb family protein [Pedobacter sp. JY14-1]
MKIFNTYLIIAAACCLTLTLSNTMIGQKKLRHVVAFSYKPDVTEAQKAKIITAFQALKKEIPEIIEFEGGADIHPEGKKFAQCFIVTVKDEKDLGIYGNHPKHKAFQAIVDPLLAEVTVVDYWTEK